MKQIQYITRFNGLRKRTSPTFRLVSLLSLCYSKKEKQMHRKHMSFCETELERDIFSPWLLCPGNVGTNGSTVITLPCRKERTPLMEKAKERNRGKTRAKDSSKVAFFLLDRSVRRPAFSLVRAGVYRGADATVSTSNWNFCELWKSQGEKTNEI